MRKGLRFTAIAASLAGTLMLSLPAAGIAAPALAGSGMRTAAGTISDAATQVRYRRHHGAAVVGGLAAGIIGAAAASALAPHYGYSYGHGSYYGGHGYRGGYGHGYGGGYGHGYGGGYGHGYGQGYGYGYGHGGGH